MHIIKVNISSLYISILLSTSQILCNDITELLYWYMHSECGIQVTRSAYLVKPGKVMTITVKMGQCYDVQGYAICDKTTLCL